MADHLVDGCLFTVRTTNLFVEIQVGPHILMVSLVRFRTFALELQPFWNGVATSTII